MFYEEITTKQNISYVSIGSLSILYNSKFILLTSSLGANAVVVTRVHCISHSSSEALLMSTNNIMFSYKNKKVSIFFGFKNTLSEVFYHKTLTIANNYSVKMYCNRRNVIYHKSWTKLQRWTLLQNYYLHTCWGITVFDLITAHNPISAVMQVLSLQIKACVF